MNETQWYFLGYALLCLIWICWIWPITFHYLKDKDESSLGLIAVLTTIGTLSVGFACLISGLTGKY